MDAELRAERVMRIVGKAWWALVLLLGGALASSAQEPQDPGFASLFNGQDLAGWHMMRAEDWHFEDGILWTEGKGGWLRSEQLYADFNLRLEYRVTKDARSGILLRASAEGDPAFTGLKIALADDAGQASDLHSTGAVYGAIIPLYSVGRPANQWNQVEISCVGRRLTVFLNGNRIHKIDFDDPAFVFAEKRPLSRVPNVGYVGLESEQNRVDFRSLRIQVIKPAA